MLEFRKNIEFIKNIEFSKIGEKSLDKAKAEALKKLRSGEEELVVYGVPRRKAKIKECVNNPL